MGAPNNISLVFLGAGPVALASLQHLEKHFAIEAVISKPDPRSSRAPRHVQQWARNKGHRLLQTESQNELESLVLNADFTSRLAVVVDYGVIISRATLDSFELGIFNSHFSLLPQWRGADPITFSLLSGQETTGVSVMKIVETLDEGELLAQEPYEMAADETIDSLTHNLVALSNSMLPSIISSYVEGSIEPYPQANEGISYSRKLSKQDGQINWSKPAKVLEREVRAFLGWPGSYTEFAGLALTITKACVIDKDGTAGTPFRHNKKLAVYCGEGALLIEKVKPAGKQDMSSENFLNGYAQRIGLK